MHVWFLSVEDGGMTRNACPSDVSDEEWAFVAPSLTMMDEDAPQRNYPLRDVSNGLRSLLRSRALWRTLPNDLPPWYVVSHQTQCWLKSGGCEQMTPTCGCCCAPATTVRLSRVP